MVGDTEQSADAGGADYKGMQRAAGMRALWLNGSGNMWAHALELPLCKDFLERLDGWIQPDIQALSGWKTGAHLAKSKIGSPRPAESNMGHGMGGRNMGPMEREKQKTVYKQT